MDPLKSYVTDFSPAAWKNIPLKITTVTKILSMVSTYLPITKTPNLSLKIAIK